MKTVKNLIEKFSDFQIFNQHIQNQFHREKDFRDSLDNKLKELYRTESNMDNIYNNIESLFSGRLSDLSSKLSSLQRSHYDMEQRIKTIEIEKQHKQIDRSNIRSGMKSPMNNKFLSSSEYLLFNLPNCNSFQFCNDCLNEKSCVWCNLERKCVPGGINGPSDGSCFTSFIYGSCPDSFCGVFKNCDVSIG